MSLYIEAADAREAFISDSADSTDRVPSSITRRIASTQIDLSRVSPCRLSRVKEVGSHDCANWLNRCLSKMTHPLASSMPARCVMRLTFWLPSNRRSAAKNAPNLGLSWVHGVVAAAWIHQGPWSLLWRIQGNIGCKTGLPWYWSKLKLSYCGVKQLFFIRFARVQVDAIC